MSFDLQKTYADLLGADEVIASQTLRALAQPAEHLQALVLLAFAHPSPDLRTESERILAGFLPLAELENYRAGFAIFQSINDFLPWMGGEYTELQAKNFAAFMPYQASYEPVLAQYPFFADLYIDLGRKLYMLFQLEPQAQSCFEGLLKYREAHDEAHYCLGRVLEKQYRYGLALFHFERCVALNRDHLYGLLQLAMLKLEYEKKPNEAIYHFQKAVDLDPYNAELHVRLAQAHYEAEDYERSEQGADIALSINEFQEEALDLKGKIYWHQKQEFDKAIEIFQKGLDHHLHGDSALLLGSMAEIQVEHLQDFDKGRFYYERSLRAQPNQPVRVRKFIELLLEKYHDQSAAGEAYAQYLAAEPNDLAMRVSYAAFILKYLQQVQDVRAQLELLNAAETRARYAALARRRAKRPLTEEEALAEIDREAQELARQIDPSPQEPTAPLVKPISLDIEPEVPQFVDEFRVYTTEEPSDESDEEDDEEAAGEASGDSDPYQSGE